MKFNTVLVHDIFNKGIMLTNNIPYNEGIIRDLWNRALNCIVKQNQLIAVNNNDEFVITLDLYNPADNEVQRFGVKAFRNYDVVKYFKFLIGAEYFLFNIKQLKEFVK